MSDPLDRWSWVKTAWKELDAYNQFVSLWSNTCFFITLDKHLQTSVGQVSQLYDTCWVRFSQSNLQKGSILPQIKISKIFMLGKGINILKNKFNQFSQRWFAEIWE
jgi:hypothetical protein